MVIDDLNLDRPRRPFGPRQANPPLVIDTDALLTLAGAFECFESIAGQVQIDERNGRLQLVELHFRLVFEPGEGLSPLSGSELSGLLVSEADDHVRCYRSLSITSSIILWFSDIRLPPPGARFRDHRNYVYPANFTRLFLLPITHLRQSKAIFSV
jgi:hypothetical protein